MKKIFYAVLTVVISVFQISCEEDFSPKAEFNSQYVLYSVFSSSGFTNIERQYCEITRTYDVLGLDPSLNKTDPVIHNALIYLIKNEMEFLMNEDTLTGEGVSRYDTLDYYYSLFDIDFIVKGGDKIGVRAELPDGKILRASTVVPHAQYIEFSYDFSRGFTTAINQWFWGSAWEIRWKPTESRLYFPSLYFIYGVLADSTEQFNSIQIPLKIIKTGTGNLPIYPSSTFEGEISYDFEAFDWAAARISEGDPDKAKYRIHSLSLGLIEYDTPLSKFYASTKGYLDKYSIRVDETMYTNINGGLGVFGSYFSNYFDFEIDENYSKSFGYRTY